MVVLGGGVVFYMRGTSVAVWFRQFGENGSLSPKGLERTRQPLDCKQPVNATEAERDCAGNSVS